MKYLLHKKVQVTKREMLLKETTEKAINQKGGFLATLMAVGLSL